VQSPDPTAVRLYYEFTTGAQRGAALDNPVVDLLVAVRDAGSIAQAATLLGCSYRHVWGALRKWEATFGEPLVSWTQGQPARLTEFGQRLLWAEMRARTRMQPHIDALRADLARVVAEARDERQQLLALHASHDLALPRLREHAAETRRAAPGHPLHGWHRQPALAERRALPGGGLPRARAAGRGAAVCAGAETAAAPR
jgi:putative molybdopterin biosynthesis protein